MSDTVRVLVISADSTVREDTMPRTGGLDYLQTQVANGTGEARGWVQCVDFPCYDMWMHEEGKIIGLPPNNLATAMWRQTYGETDIIVGDVVLTGPPDADGYSTDLPQHTLNATKALSHVVQLLPRTFDCTLN
jgi:Domain of unknown function (DUF3846)